MPELVVPDALGDHPALNDDRLSIAREMVGRQVYTFSGPLEEGCELAATLSEETGGPPVLLNDITEQTPETRVVDVYMYRNGRQMSVSANVEKPRPDET